MDLDTFNDFLTGAAGGTLVVLLRIIAQKIKKRGEYVVDCKYPGCVFKMTVSDEKYAYLCDEVMADHQNRFHPLEFKETY